jgi:hypothetical protein
VSSEQAAIEKDLDELHSTAAAAFARKDVAAYRKLFSPTLTYQQADGTIIDREQLMRDVAEQFRRLTHAASSYSRESIFIAGNEATEVLEQEAYLRATAFGFINRSWTLRRRGSYVWFKTGDTWVVQRVQVLSEAIIPEGWRFGFITKKAKG